MKLITQGLFTLLFLLPFCAQANVTLNSGRVVPTDSMIVFIFIGHSNMSGRADLYGTANTDSIDVIHSAYADTDPYLWSYYINDAYNTLYTTGTWIPAKWRVQDDFDRNAEWLGPAMPILKKLRNYYPWHHIGVIQIASGFAQLNSFYIQDQSHYSSQRWTQLRTALEALKGKVRIGGVITMLGAVEVHNKNATAADAFRTDLDTLITRIRTSAGDVTIPLLVSDLEQGSYGGWSVKNATGSSIRAQMLLAQNEISNTRRINTDWSICDSTTTCKELFRDDHHYTRVGMFKFADAALDAFFQETSIAPYCDPALACAPLPKLATTFAGTSSNSSSSSSASSSASTAGFTITSPLPESVAYIGSTLHLQWTTDPSKNIGDAYPEVSLDSGHTWLGIGLQTSVVPADDNWQDIPWTLPATMTGPDGDEIPLGYKRIQLRLTTYSGTAKAITNVLALPAATPVPFARNPETPNLTIQNGWLHVHNNAAWTLTISNPQGRTVLWRSGIAGQHNISMQHLPPGAYFVQLNGSARIVLINHAPRN